MAEFADTYETLLLRRDRARLHVTLNRPEVKNALNPTLIGAELFVATGAHPRRRTAMFTAAAIAVTLAFGLAFALGLGDLILSLVPKVGPAVKYALITAAGVVLTVMMWSAVLPPASNPFMDDHLVYAGVLVLLALLAAGNTLGLGRIWARLPLVQRATWLK